MGDAIPCPWIRDYLVDIAETHGSHLYAVPLSSKRKRVQLTDFLTFQENSYIWARASDKHHRVPIRISQEAVEEYTRVNPGRKIIDSRFSLVFINKFRPIFSPIPLGGSVPGNTPLSHLSLDVGAVQIIGAGSHQFDDPRDIESDDQLKEWVAGLRQDGGGGNVLKLRKQERDPAANGSRAPSPPRQPITLPSLSRPPISKRATSDVTQADTSRSSKPQPSKNLMRAYQKRWRFIAEDQWKYAVKPPGDDAREEPGPGPADHPVLHPHAVVSPSTPPRRTRTPAPSVPQGTPTDWSVSQPGTPLLTGARGPASHDTDALLTEAHARSDAEQSVSKSIVDSTRSQTCSLQPPPPTQRPRDPRLPYQALPSSSPPPPPSSSLPNPFSSQPPDIHRGVKRKVPRPGSPPPPLDPNNSGPVQVLVPNSDTSATNSSLPHSQSQLLSYTPAFLSSLSNGFQPERASTPQEVSKSGLSGSPLKDSQISAAVASSGHGTQLSTEGLYAQASPVSIGKRMRKRARSSPAATSSPDEARSIKVSDSQLDSEELQASQSRGTSMRDEDRGDAGSTDANYEANELSEDDAETRSLLQKPTSSGPSSSLEESLANKNGITVGQSQSLTASDRPASRCSMHSLFSVSARGTCTPSPGPSARASHQHHGQLHEHETERPIDSQSQTHHPEMWKEPSFMKAKKERSHAVLDGAERVGPSREKRRCSHQPTPPPPKRLKMAVVEGEALAAEEIKSRVSSLVSSRSTPKLHARPSKHAPSHSTKKSRRDGHRGTRHPTQHQKDLPRLAGFSVDFDNIDLGRGHPRLQLDWRRDIQSVLLRTGRIRTLGEEVERDGCVYITQD